MSIVSFNLGYSRVTSMYFVVHRCLYKGILQLTNHTHEVETQHTSSIEQV